VFGSVVIGVVKRGQVEPVLVVHHPRAVFDIDSRGAIATDAKDLPALSIRPVAAGGSVSFVVSAKGKPQAQADVTVYEAGVETPRYQFYHKSHQHPQAADAVPAGQYKAFLIKQLSYELASRHMKHTEDSRVAPLDR
jgi:hypothetical protein